MARLFTCYRPRPTTVCRRRVLPLHQLPELAVPAAAALFQSCWHRIASASVPPQGRFAAVRVSLRSSHALYCCSCAGPLTTQPPCAPRHALVSRPLCVIIPFRSFHRTVDRHDPGAPVTLPPHFPRAATHQGRRCVSSAPVAPCRGGPHSTWPGQATCAAVLAQGASPPRRTPTPRSFGRPAPFVCRSPGQRPTHSLKGSVSEAPAHASAVPVAVEVSTACVYRWQEQQPGKTWEGQCLSTGRRTLGFSAH